MRPMLATPARGVPTGPEWVHEVKWDGMRVLADVSRPASAAPAASPRLTLSSRTERDVTVAFPELAGLAEQYDDMLLDGEVVALDHGVPSFAALAERFHVTSARKAAALAASNPVTYMVFDLLRLYGVDLTSRPFADRRATLERLALSGPHWQVPPTFTDGPLLHQATLDQGLEGVVSKRLTSRYVPGLRSEDWRKAPHRSSLSVVIGGWRPETGSRDRLGAVLVGLPAGAGGPGDGLHFLGRVGSGIAGKAGALLKDDLAALTRDGSPFVETVPRVDAAGAVWVEPRLVCEVQALGVTAQHRLRQPAYRGLRPDLTPADLAADPQELPRA